MEKAEKEILKALRNNARLSLSELSEELSLPEEKVQALMMRLEKKGVIAGYDTIIDWDRTDEEIVSAIIEVKVIPQKASGFDDIAKRIYKYPEVDAVYLMSGDFDFVVHLEGRSMKEIAFFVADKLSTLPYIQSTSTHFVLKKYKDYGTIIEKSTKEPRLLVKA